MRNFQNNNNMKQIEVDYIVKRNNEVILEDFANVNLTDKNIKEIADYIRSDAEHQTAELVDIPGHIYDRIYSQVQEDAIKKSKNCGGIYTDDELLMDDLLPATLIDLLPDDVVDLLPEELFITEDDEDVICGGKVVNLLDPIDFIQESEVPTCKFDMDVNDMFLIKGRGLVLSGTVNDGHCEIGDKLILLNEENDVVQETIITAIELDQKLVDNINEIENTQGLIIGLLTPLQARKDAKGVVAAIVE